MPTRQICTKAVGVQITASVTQKYDALRLYLVREICSVIEMVPITLSQCLFRLLYRKGRRTHTVSMTVAWYTFRVDCCEFYCPQISWNLSLQRLVGSQKRSKSQPENQSQQCLLTLLQKRTSNSHNFQDFLDTNLELQDIVFEISGLSLKVKTTLDFSNLQCH